MAAYRTMKVFDGRMPKDVADGFSRLFSNARSNSVVYVEYSINDTIFVEGDNEKWVQDHKRLDAWLIENGAEGPKDPEDPEGDGGETVLICCGW